jgi:isochorismate synthase
MKNILEKTQSWFDAKLPFVIFAKPDSENLIGVFQNNDALFEIDNFSEQGFAFVSFDGESKYIIPKNESEIIVSKIIINDNFQEKNIDLNYSENDKSTFESLIKKGIQAIQNKQFDKVVLSRKEIIEIGNFDFQLVLRKILFSYTNTFRYCFYHPKIGFWIGATPEQFLQVSENVIKTVSFAGTQSYQVNETYIWPKKEQQEQQFVTDFILDSLQENTTEIKSTKPYTFRAGSIVHIKTDIEAKLNSKSDFQNIINKMHPTPAVCGLPKELSKEFILKNEDYDRTFYTGFLGELNINFETSTTKKSDLFVNLRCMNIEDNFVNIYVGCGITKDSIPENEFFETINKSKTMKLVL